MRDERGGGGHGVTNWAAMSVIDMWLAISNQETTPHWQLLTGWRRSYELTQQHLTQVKNYRNNLASVWPPEKSPAAAAYLTRLDELVNHLQGTYDAAVNNYTAFNAATMALSSARTELDKVVNEYLANEGKLAAHEREQAERPIGGLQRRAEPKPPVADGRQAELEAKARSIMYGLSREISEARTHLTQPTRYSPMRSRDEVYGVGGNSYTAPTIPPVVPIDPGISVPRGEVGAAQPPALVAPNAPASPTTHVPGLILGGVDTPSSPPLPTNGYPPLVGGSLPPATVGPTLPPVPLLPQPTGSTPARGGTWAPSADASSRAGGTPPPGSPRAMPPGGVIGGNPVGGLGQPGVGGRSTANVNPIGGVITPNNPATRTEAARHSPAPASQLINPIGARSATAIGDQPKRRWDPDNPWETAEGVAPVLHPPKEPVIDPGPAIGLR